MEQGSNIIEEEATEEMTITEVTRMNDWLKAMGMSDKDILAPAKVTSQPASACRQESRPRKNPTNQQRESLRKRGLFSFYILLGGDTMNEKVVKHKAICDELNALYARKNHDYGDSFHQTFVEEGMAMPRIRLGDKFSRFKTLTQSGGQQVTDESIRDTLLDLANYAIMTVLELDEAEKKATAPDYDIS